ncbi:CLUMA_CG001827, isoform A [Clunio marinus]|uniref:CLUMA_CG001827, isoform A n=1 Tax=Clunio marinus TaxID=568069 RepID=A0A1J1HPA3_9DIPT|nr:CLUMA_CG001827, isoform A [Clunio marinus]
MDIFITTCLILMSCALKASPLPLKSVLSDSSEDVNDIHRISSFYHRLTKVNQIGGSSKPSESMELSASNYYEPSNEYTTQPSPEDFEFEKINPSDIKNSNQNETADGLAMIENLSKNNSNITTQQQMSTMQMPPDLEASDNQKFSKLLFSSPSATVTSNGPSGPFKAIICHDCENSEGRNVGHSVSFSAIKSWNVGSSKTEIKSQLEQNPNHTVTQQQTYPVENGVNVKLEEKYFTDQHDENQQIEMNDKVELFKVENVPSVTEKTNEGRNTWKYSHLPINNENIKHGNQISPKRPIFTDLLKVPYDVLNAPLSETPPPEPVKGTEIHINHQQKFNDTITSNYQHFQQFIHKNLNSEPNTNHQHYQSTPMPEQNYEVDESVSIMTNGRAHGVQSTTARINSHQDEKNANHHQSNSPQDQEQDAKFGYVVEGRNFRKYRVEEKTADGFIVGEYGLLNNNDGSPIQGVRYTADSNINPRLIYDALLKFLSL